MGGIHLFCIIFHIFVVVKTISAKHILLIAVTVVLALPASAYTDHRGHNLDSLERVVSKWTPDAVDKASDNELLELNNAYRELMLGYNPINGEKCMFYAHKALEISLRKDWHYASQDALRYIGLQFYGREQYDSALVYFHKALGTIDKMTGDAEDLDDAYSSVYGTIGNLYNMMGDIPTAMEYYAKAGEIFDRRGWNESNTVLYYNIGETWVDERKFEKARESYDKALEYAQASGDSLMLVYVWKGYGRLYMELGKTGKSLEYLKMADAYYAAHPDYSPTDRTVNLEYMKEVLSCQKKQLWRIVGILTAVVAIVAVLIFMRLRRKSKSSQLHAARALDLSQDMDLTSREKEILDLLAKGYTSPQIAEALNLSAETVKWYRKKLLAKFDVANTAELIAAAKTNSQK